eukprot:TRINITY_DN8330_c0_g3_i1.p1 TRINITY_DN8330_c0_g3~~TRINITY_DN8330_c0_g3_i1.p1  ORF type:complete len:275 (+),score=51.94 TRINITY_DN8330_c0_g3_i1:181-1005(+)
MLPSGMTDFLTSLMARLVKESKSPSISILKSASALESTPPESSEYILSPKAPHIDQVTCLTDLKDFLVEAHAIVFFSPSGVHAVFNASKDYDWLLPQKWRMSIAIGNTTAEAMKGLGLHPTAVAKSPTPEGITEAIKSVQDQVHFAEMEDRDEAWWNLVCKSEELFYEYTSLADSMKEGFINISAARKTLGSSGLSELQYNKSMVASTRIRAVGDSYELDFIENQDDPLRWFGILVPPALRQAQQNFSQATETIIKLATMKRRISIIGKKIAED